MGIEWHIDKRIGIIISADNPVESDKDIRKLKENGFPVIVTLDDYEYNLSWKAGRDEVIRHYQCTFGDYPQPSAWELQHLNEFFLYEIAHERNAALWCRDNKVKSQVTESLRKFFKRDNMSLTEFIKDKLETQAERAAGIPERLTHCKACLDKGCITGLVCHVTSVKDAENILRTGSIFSASRARGKPGEELAEEARNAAGDPPDYFDYVMLTFGNCTAGDRLVMERELGRPPAPGELYDEFKPGVRFYFRYHDLIKHPGFRSDGYHYCKIRDGIDLEGLAAAVIAPESARRVLESGITPRFGEKLVYIDETEYPDILSWSHRAYTEAEKFIRNFR